MGLNARAALGNPKRGASPGLFLTINGEWETLEGDLNNKVIKRCKETSWGGVCNAFTIASTKCREQDCFTHFSSEELSINRF